MLNNNLVTVKFENGEERKVTEGAVLKDVLKTLHQMPENVLGLIVGNEVHSFYYKIIEDSYCKFITYNSDEGTKIYARSLKFIMYMAMIRLYGKNVTIDFRNKIGRDHLAKVKNLKVNEQVIEEIKKEMDIIISQNISFKKHKVSYARAKKIYKEMNDEQKLENLRHKLREEYTLYECAGIYNYFYGTLVPSTGYIKGYDLRSYKDGILLMLPEANDINKVKDKIEGNKLFGLFDEFAKLSKIVEVQDVSQLNKKVIDGDVGEVIRLAEADHEKRLVEVAQKICKNPKIKIVLVAGPSSSGKTTFAQKLNIHLKISGKHSRIITMDNYFKDRDNTPLGKDGKPDFENLSAMEVELFEQQMNDLINGKEVDMPIYDFKLGKKIYGKNILKLTEEDILIVEGIHALNPKVSEDIDKDSKFKIYVAPVVTLSLDHFTKVSSTDTRLIRRIVRDADSRGHGVEKTLEMWPKVRKGEEDNIFPYVNTANYIYNTSLIYELGVIKTFAQLLLLQVEETSEYYKDARRLYKLLENFKSIETGEIPVNSIIREFIGNGCFYR